MTSAVSDAVCARCHERKPAQEFPPNVQKQSGLDSWCHDCKREYQQDYQFQRYLNGNATPPSPHKHQIAKAFESGDALNYSRAVCNHVAWYTQRKITEFEAIHNKEAPPHMTAILSIAKSVAAQHPPKPKQTNQQRTYDIVCQRCNQPHTAHSPAALYCHACGPIARKERKKAWYRTPAGRRSRSKAPHVKARKQKHEKNCEVCGKTMLATLKQKYCDNCRQERQVERGKQLHETPPQLRIMQCQRCGITVTMSRAGRNRKYCLACAGEVAQERKTELKRLERLAFRERRDKGGGSFSAPATR